MIFESTRLIFRKLETTDIESYFDMQSNPRVMEMIPAKVLNWTECEKELNRLIAMYSGEVRNFNIYAVIEKASSEWIGIGGYMIKERPGIEIGYRFREKFWRRGFGTETTEALIHFVFETTDTPLIYADACKSNIGSNRILKKFMNYKGESFNKADNCMDTHYELSREAFVNTLKL